MLQTNRTFRAQIDMLLDGNSLTIAIEEGMSYYSSVISYIFSKSSLTVTLASQKWE